MQTYAEKRRITKSTPIMLVVIGCIITAGFGFIGWCGDTAVKALDIHFNNIEQKQDLLFRKLGEVNNKENSDVLCLTKSIYQCCGEKISTNC